MNKQAKWRQDHKSLEAVAAECFTYLSFKDNSTDATQKILQDAIINRTPAPSEEEDEEEGVWTDEQQEEEAAAADEERHDNLPTGDAACSCSDRLNGDSRAWRGFITLRSLTLIIITIIQ